MKGTIDGDFSSTADARVDAINRSNIGSGKYFRNSHSLSLAFTPETGLSRIFDKVGYHMTVGGKNLAVALFEAAKDLLLARSAFVFDLTKLQNEIKRFEAVIDGFTGGVTRLKMRRLQLQNALSLLHQRANPSTPKRRVRYPVTMLDTHLTETFVTIGAKELMFESAHGKVYARIIGVKEWMGFQEASLDVLSQVDAELDVCVMYRFLDLHVRAPTSRRSGASTRPPRSILSRSSSSGRQKKNRKTTKAASYWQRRRATHSRDWTPKASSTGSPTSRSSSTAARRKSARTQRVRSWASLVTRASG